MPSVLSPNGTNHEQQTFFSSDFSDTPHWLSDPIQLSHWQGRLVDSCHAINDKLSQIQNELTGERFSEAAAVPLRIVGSV